MIALELRCPRCRQITEAYEPGAAAPRTFECLCGLRAEAARRMPPEVLAAGPLPTVMGLPGHRQWPKEEVTAWLTKYGRAPVLARSRQSTRLVISDADLLGLSHALYLLPELRGAMIRVISDVELKTIKLNEASRKLRSEDYSGEAYENLFDLFAPARSGPCLYVVKLGREKRMSEKQSALVEGVLLETLSIHAPGTTVWICERPDARFMQGSAGWSEEVVSLLGAYEMVRFAEYGLVDIGPAVRGAARPEPAERPGRKARGLDRYGSGIEAPRPRRRDG